MKKRWIIEVIGILLICLFVYASTSKLLEYQVFVQELNKNTYLKHFAEIIALLVPLVEIMIAGLLAFKYTQLIGLYSSLILLIIFSIYIFLLYLSGKPLPCGCGGFIGMLTWPQHLSLNLSFILLAVTGILLYQHNYENKPRHYTKPIR